VNKKKQKNFIHKENPVILSGAKDPRYPPGIDHSTQRKRIKFFASFCSQNEDSTFLPPQGPRLMLDQHGQFQRFVSPDPQALAERTAHDRASLAADLPEDQRLTLLTRAGAALYVLGHEAEAEPMLRAALALARARGDREKEVQNLNNLATSLQYLGQRNEALALFAEALARAPDTPAWQHRDFIHHHRGRCLAELGRIAEARQDFEDALALRIPKGEAFYIDSSRRALAALTAAP
jgi:tetratricopeptide (TPR) repeat protein